MFYVAAIITLVTACLRAVRPHKLLADEHASDTLVQVMPESPVFAARLRAGQVDTRPAGEKIKTFVKSAGQAIKTNWVRCIYAVLRKHDHRPGCGKGGKS